MKHTFILTIAAAAMLGMCACDDIDDKDRLIPIEFSKSDKTVLIEEFTGSRCANCPTGAEAVAAIHAHPVYGENVIPVSLYPNQMTSLTRPYAGEPDLRTQLASDIFDKYNTRNSIPAAMFNRQTFDGDILKINPSTWSGFVSNIMEDALVPYAPVNINMETSYKADTRELTVKYLTQFVSAVPQDISFQIYILENGIITKQASSNGMIPQYENNHVLRTALHDTWGKSFGNNHIPGTSFQGESSIKLDESWVAENVQVVGFVCNTDGNHEVLHASLVSSITK